MDLWDKKGNLSVQYSSRKIVLISILQAWAWSFPILIWLMAGVELEPGLILALASLFLILWPVLQLKTWNSNQTIMSLGLFHPLIEQNKKWLRILCFSVMFLLSTAFYLLLILATVGIIN